MHFSHQLLPANGLGHRDPRRPHVTGGLGAGVLVVTFRWYGRGMMVVTMEDSLLSIRTVS